jgi:hypothetical protein
VIHQIFLLVGLRDDPVDIPVDILVDIQFRIMIILNVDLMLVTELALNNQQKDVACGEFIGSKVLEACHQ